jgi:hypothetical protein
MKMEDITKSISEKLGEAEASKIADDMASLLTLDSGRIKEMKNKDNEIAKLKKDKEMLIQANANLFQQISQETEDILEPKVEEEKPKEPFDMRSVFDEKGRFKTKL